jgi:predicted dinucleotide-binding enzyme
MPSCSPPATPTPPQRCVRRQPAGKVVIDITNPLTADYMGLTLGHSTSAAEEIAQAVPGAEVVKAFNTVFAQVLAEGADFGNGRRSSVFVASDSARAKQTATHARREHGLQRSTPAA